MMPMKLTSLQAQFFIHLMSNQMHRLEIKLVSFINACFSVPNILNYYDIFQEEKFQSIFMSAIRPCFRDIFTTNFIIVYSSRLIQLSMVYVPLSSRHFKAATRHWCQGDTS